MIWLDFIASRHHEVLDVLKKCANKNQIGLWTRVAAVQSAVLVSIHFRFRYCLMQ